MNGQELLKRLELGHELDDTLTLRELLPEWKQVRENGTIEEKRKYWKTKFRYVQTVRVDVVRALVRKGLIKRVKKTAYPAVGEVYVLA